MDPKKRPWQKHKVAEDLSVMGLGNGKNPSMLEWDFILLYSLTSEWSDLNILRLFNYWCANRILFFPIIKGEEADFAWHQIWSSLITLVLQLVSIGPSNTGFFVINYNSSSEHPFGIFRIFFYVIFSNFLHIDPKLVGCVRLRINMIAFPSLDNVCQNLRISRKFNLQVWLEEALSHFMKAPHVFFHLLLGTTVGCYHWVILCFKSLWTKYLGLLSLIFLLDFPSFPRAIYFNIIICLHLISHGSFFLQG